MPFFRKYFWTLLLTLVVFILSIIPLHEMPPLPGVPLTDKWVHFLMYGALSAAAWIDIFRRRDTPWWGWQSWVHAVLFPTAFGALMEVWQEYLTTTRNGDLLDWIANVVGVLIAVPVGLLLIRPVLRARKAA